MLPAILAPAELADAAMFDALAAELAAELHHGDPDAPAFDWFGPPIEGPLAPWWPELIGPEYATPSLASLWRELSPDESMTGWTRRDAAALEAALAAGARDAARTFTVPFTERSTDWDTRVAQLADALNAGTEVDPWGYAREPAGRARERFSAAPIEGTVVDAQDIAYPSTVRITDEPVTASPAPVRMPTRGERARRWLRHPLRGLVRWATGWDGATRSYGGRP